MKTKTLEKIVCAVVAAMMVMTLVPAPAYAKTRSVSVSPATYSNGRPANWKRLYKGTTRVTLRKGEGEVYFRAPKKGTYTFRISNLTGKKGKFSSCCFLLRNKSGEGQFPDVLFSRYKYKKGAWANDNGFMLAMAGKKLGYWPRYIDADRPQKSMTAKIALKKGETLGIHFEKPETCYRNPRNDYGQFERYTEKTKVTVKIS